MRADVIGSEEGGPGGKALLQPELIPPGKGHQVAKPLVGNLGCISYKIYESKLRRWMALDQDKKTGYTSWVTRMATYSRDLSLPWSGSNNRAVSLSTG